jgi:hypothetical protein
MQHGILYAYPVVSRSSSLPLGNRAAPPWNDPTTFPPNTHVEAVYAFRSFGRTHSARMDTANMRAQQAQHARNKSLPPTPNALAKAASSKHICALPKRDQAPQHDLVRVDWLSNAQR